MEYLESGNATGQKTPCPFALLLHSATALLSFSFCYRVIAEKPPEAATSVAIMPPFGHTELGEQAGQAGQAGIDNGHPCCGRDGSADSRLYMCSLHAGFYCHSLLRTSRTCRTECSVPSTPCLSVCLLACPSFATKVRRAWSWRGFTLTATGTANVQDEAIVSLLQNMLLREVSHSVVISLFAVRVY